MKKMFKKISMFMLFAALSITAFGQKVLITSFGQSADASILKVLFKKSKVANDFKPLINADGIKGYDVLVISAGASSKGMGAAGIDPLDELQRSKDIVKEAKAENIPIVMFHLGGEARRGKLSNQYIEVAGNAAKKIVAVKGGNYDGMLSNMASKNGGEFVEVPNMVKALPEIKADFTK